MLLLKKVKAIISNKKEQKFGTDNTSYVLYSIIKVQAVEDGVPVQRSRDNADR